MTDLQKAAQMALHAMHSAREFLATVEDHRARMQETRLHDAMREVRTALEQNNSDVVKLPTSTEEAIAMQRVSYAYLEQHAPEVLAQQDEADITYEVWQDDEWQAGSNSKDETMRYAMQYAEDGAVEVHEITRRVICKIEK